MANEQERASILVKSVPAEKKDSQAKVIPSKQESRVKVAQPTKIQRKAANAQSNEEVGVSGLLRAKSESCAADERLYESVFLSRTRGSGKHHRFRQFIPLCGACERSEARSGSRSSVVSEHETDAYEANSEDSEERQLVGSECSVRPS